MKWISVLAVIMGLAACGTNDGVSVMDESSRNQKHAVLYDGNGSTGGTAPVDSNSPYRSTSSVTVLGNIGNLVKTGYAFLGWNTESDGSGSQHAPASTFSMIDSTLTLYAHWGAGNSLTYNGNGATEGTPPTDLNSPYGPGQSVTVLGNTEHMERGGYSFSGWNTEADGSGTSYSAGSTFQMGALATTLYAQWQMLATYTVTYSDTGKDSGSAPVDDSRYWPGESVPVHGNYGNLVKAGHSFAGWNISSDSSEHAIDESFPMLSANVTLVPRWVPSGSYSLSYNGNGHTSGSIPAGGNTHYVSGSSVNVVGNTGSMTRGGDSFLGWNTAANGTGTDYSSGDVLTISEHTVLYARWDSRYTVQFDANSGSGSMSAIEVSAGANVKLPLNIFAKADALFAGWAISPTGPVAYTDHQTIRMERSNKTLYAKWMPAQVLQVKYDFNQNVLDSSGKGKDGAANNITYVPDGPGNYAVRMNGTSSFVALPNSIVHNYTSFTIMMRFKASPSEGGSLFGYQNGGAGTVTGQHVPMIVVRSDGRLRGELWTASNTQLEVISDKAVNDGKWHTVYFSSDGITIKLFLDGVLLSEASDSAAHLSMLYNQIGTSRTRGRTLMPHVDSTINEWYYFSGLIDDFFFYSSSM